MVKQECEKKKKYCGGVMDGLIYTASFFRKTSSWAETYHNISGIIPELADQIGLYRRMSSVRRKGFKLPYVVTLARKPREKQMEIFETAKPHFDKSDEEGMKFISEVVLGMVSEEELLVGGNPSGVEQCVRRLVSNYDEMLGCMTSQELKEVVSFIPPRSIPRLRSDLRIVLAGIQRISDLVEARR
jgi:hypothetical protein